MDLVAVELLVGKIISILKNETSLIGGVYNELDELKRELQCMQAFLNDVDGAGALNKGQETWVAEVRDMCYPIEDIIDEFMYHMNKQQGGQGWFTKLLYQTIHMPKNLWMKHHIAKRLHTINRNIKSISERIQRYGVHRIEGSTSSRDDQRRVQNKGDSIIFANDDHLVGIENDHRRLVEWLTNREPERIGISVVGMGGSGKSTLVAKAYKNLSVKRHFDCYAWITITQTYIVEDVFKSMIKEFYNSRKENVPGDLSCKTYKELLEMLVYYLQPKRYVIVLDDVWTSELWSDIEVSLPNDGLGSRVMLTTRNEKIVEASFGLKSHVLHIKPLNPTDAWDLFCMKAFSYNINKSCPEELQNVAHELVAKCGGLPLAILALGGLMSPKILVSDWIDFNSSLNHELSRNPELEVVKSILMRSFIDLPFRHKRCFLYCCIFPEDYSIKKKRLIRLWMAEGFVEEQGTKTPERVAEEYLMELVHRNMVHVVTMDEARRPRGCKLHDLMRELALSRSKTEKFCVVYDGREASEEVSGARRLSVQTRGTKDLKFFNGLTQLRSLFMFVSNMLFLPDLPSNLKFLRVLDLQGAPVQKLPDNVADIFNLRYLNLKRTKVKKLPKSIGRLHNLQTLNIANSKIKVLPGGILKLQKLRHLILYHYNDDAMFDGGFYYIGGTSWPLTSSVSKLNNLPDLVCVEAEQNLLKQLRSMTQLTKLGITKLRKEDEENLCILIQSMILLRNLYVMVTDEEEFLGIDAFSSGPPCLEKLFLGGKLENVPCWLRSVKSLTSLCLHWSKLSENLLVHIQELPNLGRLLLINAYEGNLLCFSSGFSKLTCLTLRSLSQLNQIIIEKGVMPGLQKLYLDNCMELKTLPQGIEYLTNLEELNLFHVSTELVESVRGEESVDRLKVRHIPRINRFYKSNFGVFS